MDRVYIAGPIRRLREQGISIDDIVKRFEEGAARIGALGFDPVLPPNLRETEKSWEECMIPDLHVLLDVDGIYLLHGWQNSKGATLERQLALALGKFVMSEDPQSV